MTPSILSHISCALLSYAAFLAAFVSAILFLLQERQLKRKRMGWLFHRLPSLGELDRINFLSVSIGFVLLSGGTILGFIGAEQMKGEWWTGDPKEIMTVLLWGAYCFLWLVRVRSSLRGRRVALLSIVGFSLVLFSYLGIRWMPTWHPSL